MSLTLPNKAEKEVFVWSDILEPAAGLVMMCDIDFGWGKVPEHFTSVSELTNVNTLVDIVVNGINIRRSTNIRDSCYILEHENGYFFPSSAEESVMGDNDGEYGIKIRIVKEGGWAIIGSIVVVYATDRT